MIIKDGEIVKLNHPERMDDLEKWWNKKNKNKKQKTKNKNISKIYVNYDINR